MRQALAIDREGGWARAKCIRARALLSGSPALGAKPECKASSNLRFWKSQGSILPLRQNTKNQVERITIRTISNCAKVAKEPPRGGAIDWKTGAIFNIVAHHSARSGDPSTNKTNSLRRHVERHARRREPRPQRSQHVRTPRWWEHTEAGEQYLELGDRGNGR